MNRVSWVAALGAMSLNCFTLVARADNVAKTEGDQLSTAPAWTAGIPALLSLSAPQQKAFATYVEIITPRKRTSLSADQFLDLTLTSRTDYLAEQIQKDLIEIQRQSAALHAFYALLSTDQRSLLDQTTRSKKGHPGVAAGVIPIPPPDTPNYALPSHTDPAWLIKPSGDDIDRVYPTTALAKRTSGGVTMTCVADEDGYLKDCVVNEESPKDLGFGNAALELTAYMRMQPATNYGIPVESQVTVPIRFAAGQ